MTVELAVAEHVRRAALDERHTGGEDHAGETSERPLDRSADAVAVFEVVAHDHLRRHRRQVWAAMRRELPLK